MKDVMHLVAIGTATASGRVDNVEQAKKYEKDEDFLSARLGPRTLPEITEGETAISLAKLACERAFAKSGINPDEVGLLVLVSQNPDFGGLPHNSAVLQGELGLSTSSICFDVGLGCSGYVYGLSIVDAMMTRLGIRHALLVTSDQYRPKLKQGDANTQLLFGDGAAATLLTLTENTGFRYCGARLGTDGTKHTALIRKDEGIFMNGRAVFGFSRKTVPAEITAFLDDQGVAIEDIDQVLLHQGSQAIITEISKALDLPPERVPVGLKNLGNTVSSSIPFLMEPALENSDPKRLLLAGFGVGLSWGIALFERKGAG